MENERQSGFIHNFTTAIWGREAQDLTYVFRSTYQLPLGETRSTNPFLNQIWHGTVKLPYQETRGCQITC